jgi:hypothetical protein
MSKEERRRLLGETDAKHRRLLEERLTDSARSLLARLAEADDFEQAMYENQPHLDLLTGYWRAFRGEWFDPTHYRDEEPDGE